MQGFIFSPSNMYHNPADSREINLEAKASNIALSGIKRDREILSDWEPIDKISRVRLTTLKIKEFNRKALAFFF